MGRARLRGTLQSVDRENQRRPAPVRVTGTWARPRIAGALRLVDAAGPLPVSWKPAREPALPALDAELDLRFIAGENVAFKNPLAELRLGGSLAITNSVAAPVVRGQLNVHNGTLLLPTMRESAPLLAKTIDGTHRRPPSNVAAFNRFGTPALSVPCGFSRDGLPVGLQLVAAHGRDRFLLEAAAALEAHLRATPRPAR